MDRLGDLVAPERDHFDLIKMSEVHDLMKMNLRYKEDCQGRQTSIRPS